MVKHMSIVIARYTLCLVCVLGFLLGCGDKKAESDKPKVVSKKITMPAAQTEKSPAAQTQQSPPAEKASVPEVSPDTATPKTAAPSPAPPKALPMLTAMEEDRGAETIALIYDPKGKIDPFMPLFREEPAEEVAQTASKKVARKKRVATTPLERISLNQLKLVATIRAASGNRALVEDAAGKGYIVKMGTYIGINSGSVIGIHKDRLVVEEEVETLLGEITLQKRELKLQKPPGE